MSWYGNKKREAVLSKFWFMPRSRFHYMLLTPKTLLNDEKKEDTVVEENPLSMIIRYIQLWQSLTHLNNKSVNQQKQYGVAVSSSVCSLCPQHWRVHGVKPKPPLASLIFSLCLAWTKPYTTSARVMRPPVLTLRWPPVPVMAPLLRIVLMK